MRNANVETNGYILSPQTTWDLLLWVNVILVQMTITMTMTVTGLMVRLEGRVPRHQTPILSHASCKQFKINLQNNHDFDNSKSSYSRTISSWDQPQILRLWYETVPLSVAPIIFMAQVWLFSIQRCHRQQGCPISQIRARASLNCSEKGGQFSGLGESEDLNRDTNQRRAVNALLDRW